MHVLEQRLKAGRKAYPEWLRSRWRVCVGGSWFLRRTRIRRGSPEFLSSSEQDNSHANAHSHGFGASGRSQLVEDGADVEFDSVVGDAEAECHFAVAEPLGQLQRYGQSAALQFTQQVARVLNSRLKLCTAPRAFGSSCRRTLRRSHW